MKRQTFYTGFALIAGILLMLNLIGREWGFRFDLTDDDQYTLSQATSDVLTGLQEPVTVKGYFSANLPPDIARTRTEFQDMLAEYNSTSDGNLVFEFINPNADETSEMEAMQQGISPVMINVRERDQMTQQRAFLGATVQLGEETETIPFLQPGAAMEYALTTAVKKLAVADKPAIAFLQGHGEPPLAALQQASEALSVLYQINPVTLTESTGIPEQYRTLAIVAPTDSLPPSHLAHLDAFLARGGNLFVALNRVDGDLNTGTGRAVNTGLETWLRDKGLEVEDRFITDVSCASVGVQQRQGPFVFTNNVSFPYLPILSTFADHPVVDGLEAVVMQFASPVRFTGDSTLTYTPLAFTSNQSGSAALPLFFDIEKEWLPEDFPEQNLPVAGIIEGPIGGTLPARLVVVGDGDFAVNGTGQTARAQEQDNISLLVNGIDWLSDDTGLIQLRTKGVTARPIIQLEDGTKTLLKYGNFLLPILLVIGYGLFRARLRKHQRELRKS